jgi:5-methylcytosine-specific restriction endonuclease McrA
MSAQPARPDHDDYTERKRSAPWFRLDADFLGDDRIIEIGEAFGPAGPAVFVALMGAAKTQNENGTVRFGWRALARTCFLSDVDLAQQVVGACEDAGLLIVKAFTDRGFTAEIVKWDLYQRPPKEAKTPAERQQEWRDRQREKGYEWRPLDKATHATIIERDGRCLKCGATEDLQVDHILSLTRGGTHDEDNLQTLCRKCNRKKATFDHTDYRSKSVTGADSNAGSNGRAAESNAVARTVDSRQQTSSVVPQQQQVAPAAAALHPAFADVMAIAQEACTAASKMLPPSDAAILSTLNAYPAGDHLQAAQLAKADVCAGLAKQPHFHRILGWKLKDQTQAPPAHVTARDERKQREQADLAALERLQARGQ